MPQTLHESVSTTLPKTPSGEFFDKDVKEIFCMMVICLRLTAHTDRFLSRSHPYSFQQGKALEVMEHLNIDVDLSSATTSIRYSIKAQLAMVLLRRFFAAKLLHCPADRTRQHPKDGVAMQPTAKGVAVLGQFCRELGMSSSQQPSILASRHHSMDLLCFDRHSRTDAVYQLEYLVVVVFMRLMGPAPNVWSPSNSPAPVTIQDFDHDLFSLGDTSSGKRRKIKALRSPYHHRYFTNPDSDSQMQYYESSSGVRVFHNRHFGSKTYEYCVTGKAVCQWLCDCTDIMSVAHAVDLLVSLVRARLIKPVKGAGDPVRSFYVITSLGHKHCQWGAPVQTVGFGEDPEPTPEERGDPIRLLDVLNDPGMRYLYRTHLEQSYCAENLLAYLQLKQYGAQVKVLNELAKAQVSKQITRVSNVCASLAYSIYFKYLSAESPFSLNVDYALREEITNIMMDWSPSPDEPPETGGACQKTGSPNKTGSPIACITISTPSTPSTSSSETDEPSSALTLIARATPVYLRIQQSIFRLMETDSFPKFLAGDVYRQAVGRPSRQSSIKRI